LPAYTLRIEKRDRGKRPERLLAHVPTLFVMRAMPGDRCSAAAQYRFRADGKNIG
jgi:hypothetical protein